jgi:hypothetical protein
MRQEAAVEARGGRLFVSSWSVTKYGASVQGGWIKAAAELVTDAVLGGLVRSALAHSRTGVPHPDFRKGPMPERLKLLALAGVKSETQYERGLRVVSVSVDDPGSEVKITPYRNGGRREGISEMLDQVITVDASADDASLGAAVRSALVVATDGT